MFHRLAISLVFIVVLTIGVLPNVIRPRAEAAVGAAPGGAAPQPKPAPGRASPPNILMLLLDDAGIDQWRSFTYGGPVPASMPALDAIARAGTRFTNTWSMPACSPGRATIFTGRYPQRTGVVSATLAWQDLANSSVSPYEATLPKVLATAGYRSAMFGKFHMGGPANNPDGINAPIAQGWDYYYGVQQDVTETDTTAGGVAPEGTHRWGYVEGQEYGACHFENGTCDVLPAGTIPADSPGRTCMERGGVFVKEAACSASSPSLNFGRYNGHYVWPRVIARKGEDGLADVARGYHDSAIVDQAIEWIGEQESESRPWFAVLSTANIHTPYQPPPRHLVDWHIPADCGAACADRLTANAMLEAVDAEVARLLVATGIARRDAGQLVYEPAASNTMVMLVADNGTWSMIVKPPFDLSRGKGTAYQTGVWVPLFVAGPKVAPAVRGTFNDAPVNVADLYRLTAELAGVNVDRLVPRGRVIDAHTMIGYLSNPDRRTALNRSVNFTEQGIARKVPDSEIYACLIRSANICTDAVLDSKGLCESNGGDWYGPDGKDSPMTYRSCCDLAEAYPESSFFQQPLYSRAVRRDDFKLVEQTMRNCDTGEAERFLELYRVENRPINPVLDRADDDLLAAGPESLTPEQQSAFVQLQKDLQAIVSSEVFCPGDGNMDKVVNADDVAGWKQYEGVGSSVFDLNFDAQTDQADLAIIEANLGRDCRPRGAASGGPLAPRGRASAPPRQSPSGEARW
jgi:arylsulfatase A-like enzyme